MDSELTDITIRVGRLTITVHSASATTTISPPAEPVPPPVQPPFSTRSAPPSTSSSTSAPPRFPFAQRATSAEPSLEVLQSGRLLTELCGVSGEDRVRIAYQLGREAAEFLRGERAVQGSGARVPGRKACYVILAAERLPGPVWVRTAGAYFPLVQTGGRFQPESCSQAFASQIEGGAFCVGAGLPGLCREY
jgi:hypothetical protein